MLAIFSAVGVVSVRPIAETHTYMYVGISIDEVVTIYKEIRKIGIHSDFASTRKYVLTLSKSK